MSETGKNLFVMKRHVCRKPGDKLGPSRFNHQPYEIDEELDTVQCGTCGEKLNPVQVLKSLYQHENRLEWRWQELKQAIEKLKFKFARQNRVRCEHCQKLTKIAKVNDPS